MARRGARGSTAAVACRAGPPCTPHTRPTPTRRPEPAARRTAAPAPPAPASAGERRQLGVRTHPAAVRGARRCSWSNAGQTLVKAGHRHRSLQALAQPMLCLPLRKPHLAQTRRHIRSLQTPHLRRSCPLPVHTPRQPLGGRWRRRPRIVRPAPRDPAQPRPRPAEQPSPPLHLPPPRPAPASGPAFARGGRGAAAGRRRGARLMHTAVKGRAGPRQAGTARGGGGDRQCSAQVRSSSRYEAGVKQVLSGCKGGVKV